MNLISLIAAVGFLAAADEPTVKPETKAAIYETLAEIKSAEASLERARGQFRDAVERIQKQLSECGCELREEQGKTLIARKPAPKPEAKKP